jgi:hypothetical protein
MAQKLDWETDLYRRERDLQPKLWRAFNVAVTAWHMSDWVFIERRDAGVLSGQVQDFQIDVQARCRALRLCKHVATASKHYRVERKPDPSIKVIVQANETPIADDMSDVDDARHWDIVILDDTGPTDALAVFYAAQAFWDAEIRDDERRSEPDRFASED